MAATAALTTFASTEPATAITPILTDVDNTSSPTQSTETAYLAEESLSQPPPPSPSRTRRESNISETDPNAFKITILLASSGYRTQITINRSFLEKSSTVDGDGFLVSQLKNALWKDWPAGILRFSGKMLILVDWPDALPPSPNFLRLIYGGKMLADKSTLTGLHHLEHEFIDFQNVILVPVNQIFCI